MFEFICTKENRNRQADIKEQNDKRSVLSVYLGGVLANIACFVRPYVHASVHYNCYLAQLADSD